MDFGSTMQLNTNVAHVNLMMKMRESRLLSGQHDRSKGRTLKEIHLSRLQHLQGDCTYV